MMLSKIVDEIRVMDSLLNSSEIESIVSELFEAERRITVMEKALKDIKKHQAAVGLALKGFSVTYTIAQKALEECGCDE